MSKFALTPGTKLNLSGVSILLVQGVAAEMDILTQVFSGLGAKTLSRAETAERGMQIVEATALDLVVVDSALPDSDGFAFVRRLRRCSHEVSRYAPVMLVTGHTQKRKIANARDSGVNFVVAKPITPQVMFQRIAWMSRDTRPFVECDTYRGPDRRFKILGPPAGMRGRREADFNGEVGAATTPNMSQDDIDAMFNPQRVSL